MKTGKRNIGRQIDQRQTKQARISIDLHKTVKVDTSRQGETIRERLDRYIQEGLERDSVDIEQRSPPE